MLELKIHCLLWEQKEGAGFSVYIYIYVHEYMYVWMEIDDVFWLQRQLNNIDALLHDNKNMA